MKKNRR
ncbi:hypothetical protein ACTA71_008763 [Dictyostelium dimigraforme]